MTANAKNQPGIGVDSAGGAVIDPTANVIALVEAGMKRQDDLRTATTAHIHEMAEMRSLHYADLRNAEAARIDAIRAVDVHAVQRASEVQLAQATALATQVSVSAETLRAQVAAAQSAAAVSLAAALVPIQEAVADLRRVQYEQQGQKVAVSETRSDDSAMAALLAPVMRGQVEIREELAGMRAAKTAITEAHIEKRAVNASVMVALGLGVALLALVSGIAGHFVSLAYVGFHFLL